MAGHLDADSVLASLFAEDSDERAILAARISENDAVGMAFFYKILYIGNSCLKLLLIIAHSKTSFRLFFVDLLYHRRREIAINEAHVKNKNY